MVLVLLDLLRFVQKLMMKLAATVLLGLVALGAFYYRSELGELREDLRVPRARHRHQDPEGRPPERRRGVHGRRQ